MKYFDLKKMFSLSFGSNPWQDWAVLIIIFLIINIISAVWAVYFFYGINAGDFFAVSKAHTSLAQMIDRTTLDTVIKAMNARSARFNDLQQNSIHSGPGAVDPSL